MERTTAHGSRTTSVDDEPMTGAVAGASVAGGGSATERIRLERLTPSYVATNNTLPPASVNRPLTAVTVSVVDSSRTLAISRSRSIDAPTTEISRPFALNA